MDSENTVKSGSTTMDFEVMDLGVASEKTQGGTYGFQNDGFGFKGF